MKSAAADQWPTDGATGQPLRAADVELQSSKLSAIREAEGSWDCDVSPCEEGIAAVEDRAHTASWHQYLSLPDDN